MSVAAGDESVMTGSLDSSGRRLGVSSPKWIGQSYKKISDTRWDVTL